MLLQKPLIDTNILIDFFTENQFVKQATLVLENGFYYNIAVLFELSNFLNNRFGAKKTLQIIEILDNSNPCFEILEINPKHQTKAREIMTKYSDQNLSLVDCILIAQAKEFNLELKTLDQKMTFCKEASITKPY